MKKIYILENIGELIHVAGNGVRIVGDEAPRSEASVVIDQAQDKLYLDDPEIQFQCGVYDFLKEMCQLNGLKVKFK